MVQKLLGIFSFIIGISTSFITNLISAEDDINSLYKNNRQEFLIAGLILIVIGIIITYYGINSENKRDGIYPNGNILGSFISTTIIWACYGLAIGLFTHYFYIYYNGESLKFLNNFIKSTKPLIISCILSGAFAGYNLYYTYDYDKNLLQICGMLFGGFLGWVFSTNFNNEDFTILKNIKINNVVLGAIIISATISSFISIFKPSYDARVSKRQSKIADNVKIEKILEKEDEEKFEIYKIMLLERNLYLKSTNPYLNVLSLLYNVDLNEVEKKLEETDSGYYKLLLLNKKIKAPFRIFDINGKEVIRFENLKSLKFYIDEVIKN